ncbi:ribosomal protein L14-domain-containing protein [Pavlovales sp. CCMP2436]|nr:ribosomal protein L14-domain-containing protein [Pavlovales sp. CCMP2436]
MPYKRFVELGRVCLVTYGPDKGKLCTIVDVIDHNRVLVDGPSSITGIHHQPMPIKRLMLTDLKVATTRNARQTALIRAWEEADVLTKWNGSSWAKKLADKQKRAAMSDFDRFEVMVARKTRAAAMK